MNILLTCSGRRNYLVSYFKKALTKKGKVFAADSDPKAPSLSEADKYFVVPRVNDPNYINKLVEICTSNNVQAIIPLNDLELPILSAKAEIFKEAGIVPIVSSPEVINICFDKWETVKFANKIGIGTPKTYGDLNSVLRGILNKEVAFPLVVKPRWGSASICVEYAYDERELRMVLDLTNSKLERTFLYSKEKKEILSPLLIQEKLEGQEFGLDVVNDLKGENAAVLVKQKLAMRAGETDKAITVNNPEVEDVGRKIGRTLGHIGNLDCDLFQNGKGVFLLEMNPRFGGGYPFSHIAGANLPAALLFWLRNERAPEELLTVEIGVLSAKCDRLVITKAR